MSAMLWRRLLRAGTIFSLVVPITLCVLWWKLPAILNRIANNKLEAAGFEETAIHITQVNSDRLLIDRAKISGTGWEIQLFSTTVNYDWVGLLKKKRMDSIQIGRLLIEVDMEILTNSAGRGFQLEMLQHLPLNQLVLDRAELVLQLKSGTLTTDGNGSLTVHSDNTLEFAIPSLQLKLLSEDAETLLRIPQSGVPGDSALITVKANPQFTRVNLNLAWPNFQASGKNWKIQEGNMTGEFHYDQTQADFIATKDRNVFQEEISRSFSGNFQMSANQVSAANITAQWTNIQLGINNELLADPLNTEVQLSAGMIHIAEESLEQLSFSVDTAGSLELLKGRGSLDFLFDGIEAKTEFNHTIKALLDQPSLTGEYTIFPMAFDYSDLVSRHVTAARDLSFSGILSARGTYRVEETGADLTGLVKYKDGVAAMPDSKLNASGIAATVAIQSFAAAESAPGASSISIDLIELGDLVFKDTHLQFDLVNAHALYLSSGKSSVFEGQILLPPSNLALNPLTFESELQFEALSLRSISEEMSFFNGTMEGTISGFLPLSYSEGQLRSGEGLLQLTEGTSARLKYNTAGLLDESEPSESGFLQSFTDKLLGRLKLAPEKVVKDALGDLKINELSIELLSSATPETPIQIHLAGEGYSGKTLVPMNLDTNINGSLDELFQFLLRINSLGKSPLK